MRSLPALVALLLLSALTAAAQNNIQLVIEGKVINVHDGHTVTVVDKDNKNSKKYHLQGCPGYNQVGEKNRVYFKTAAEAEVAGYAKAGHC